MELSSREWASLLWIAVFIGCAQFRDKNGQIAKGFRNVLRAFSAPKIVVILAWASLWIVLCVQMLRYVGAWEIANLKTTLLWAVTFAFVTLFDIGRISEDDTYFRKTVRDTLGATVAIAFIAEAYSFPFAVELILIPLLALMTGVQVVSEKKPEYVSAHKLASTTLALAGVAYVGYGLYVVVNDFHGFATWNTLREFLIPIVLSLLFLPYLYFVSVLVSYELTFVGLRWALKDDALRRYASFQAVVRFRFDLEGLRRWKRHVSVFRPESRKDIRESIAEVKANQKKEHNPLIVSPDLGWCPIAATKFLAEQGLATGSYHRMDDGQWWASSPMVELNKAAIFPDNIAYYVEGDEGAAKRLKVKLHVNDRPSGVASDLQFRAVCAALLGTAAKSILPAQQRRILQSDAVDVEAGGRRIRLQKEDFTNPARGYSRMLTVDHNPTYRGPYERAAG